MSTIHDIFGEVIHAYTRAQAISDGVLVDVTGRDGGSREAGLRWPVAMTATAYEQVARWDEGATGNVDPSKPYTGNSTAGRLWDVMSCLRTFALPGACRQAQREGSARVPFEVLAIPATGRGTTPRLNRLVLALGPGDDGTPVLTVMLPGED